MNDIRIAITQPGIEPHPSAYRHTDVDGDRLLIATSLIPDVGPGIYFRTDPAGSSISIDQLPNLIARLQVIADASREEAEQHG